MGATELADLVVHLPPGCALWRDAGGPRALTDESHLLREAIFRLEVADWHATGSKGAAPKRIELPKAAGEIQASQRAFEAKAAQHARRQRAQTT
jgi:hypothetical protein